MLRDPFYSVLALVCHLLSLAVLFLLLRAEFVAAVQVVVYAGAVMVLYVFVVAYVGGEERRRSATACAAAARRLGAACAWAARCSAAALLVELLIALLGTGLKAVDSDGAAYVARTDDLRHPRLHRQPAAHPLPARVRDRVLPAADRRRGRRRAGAPARRLDEPGERS